MESPDDRKDALSVEDIDNGFSPEVKASLEERLPGYDVAERNLVFILETIASRSNENSEERTKAMEATAHILGILGNILAYGSSQKPLDTEAIKRAEMLSKLVDTFAANGHASLDRFAEVLEKMK